VLKVRFSASSYLVRWPIRTGVPLKQVICHVRLLDHGPPRPPVHFQRDEHLYLSVRLFLLIAPDQRLPLFRILRHETTAACLGATCR